jgi:hypothetical protein
LLYKVTFKNPIYPTDSFFVKFSGKDTGDPVVTSCAQEVWQTHAINMVNAAA